MNRLIFFRKQLGAYKQKIEAIFARLTLAQDVLTSRQRREEYDDYLDQTHRNRSMSALLDQTPNEIAKVVSSLDTMPVSEPAASAPPRSGDPSGVRSSDPGPMPAPRVTDPVEVARARREAAGQMRLLPARLADGLRTFLGEPTSALASVRMAAERERS